MLIVVILKIEFNIDGRHMTSSKHYNVNYDQFAPNFDMEYSTIQCYLHNKAGTTELNLMRFIPNAFMRIFGVFLDKTFLTYGFSCWICLSQSLDDE